MIKKVLTAIGNSTLNKKIKKLDDYQILTKDIPNDEELIEWLEREENVEFLFLCSNVIHKYQVDEFIKMIRKLQPDIIIFFFKGENIESSVKEDDNLKIYTGLEVEWKFFEKILQKGIRKNIRKCTSKVVAISGASGVRQKYVFHIFCQKCGR